MTSNNVANLTDNGNGLTLPKDIVVIKLNSIGQIDYAISRLSHIRVVLIEDDLVGEPHFMDGENPVRYIEKQSVISPHAINLCMSHIDY